MGGQQPSCFVAASGEGARLQLRMPATVACIEDACRLAREHLIRHDAAQEAFTLILGIRETLLNAMLHGSGNDPAKIVTMLLDVQPDRASIEVEDQGPGFDWQARSQEPPAPEAVSGRGLPIVHSCFDEVEFNARGNRIRLSKRLRRNAAMSEITRQGETVQLTPRGDIVAAVVQELRQELKTLVDEGARHLVLDCAEVDMVDSVGIGLLIATHNSLKARGGGLALIRVGDDIAGLFKAMRLDKHFELLRD